MQGLKPRNSDPYKIPTETFLTLPSLPLSVTVFKFILKINGKVERMCFWDLEANIPTDSESVQCVKTTLLGTAHAVNAVRFPRCSLPGIVCVASRLVLIRTAGIPILHLRKPRNRGMHCPRSHWSVRASFQPRRPGSQPLCFLSSKSKANSVYTLLLTHNPLVQRLLLEGAWRNHGRAWGQFSEITNPSSASHSHLFLCPIGSWTQVF